MTTHNPLRSALSVIITSVLFVLDRLRLDKLDVWTEGEGVKPKIKNKKPKNPKELKHFQLRTVRPEQDPRGAEQRSETPHEQPHGKKKKGFILCSCLPFDLYWSCKQSVHGEKPRWRACLNTSIPVEVTIWGMASLFCCKAPWEKRTNKQKKKRHDISCKGVMPRRGASGPRTTSDGVIFIHVKSPSRSHKHARELLEL